MGLLNQAGEAEALCQFFVCRFRRDANAGLYQVWGSWFRSSLPVLSNPILRCFRTTGNPRRTKIYTVRNQQVENRGYFPFYGDDAPLTNKSVCLGQTRSSRCSLDWLGVVHLLRLFDRAASRRSRVHSLKASIQQSQGLSQGPALWKPASLLCPIQREMRKGEQTRDMHRTISADPFPIHPSSHPCVGFAAAGSCPSYRAVISSSHLSSNSFWCGAARAESFLQMK